jgi:hypothetical protein
VYERRSTRKELIAALNEAEESLRNGRGRIVTKYSRQKFLDDICRRGRQRLAVKRLREAFRAKYEEILASKR